MRKTLLLLVTYLMLSAWGYGQSPLKLQERNNKTYTYLSLKDPKTGLVQVEAFEVWLSNPMHPDLAMKYPGILNYQGRSLEHPDRYVALTVYDGQMNGVLNVLGQHSYVLNWLPQEGVLQLQEPEVHDDNGQSDYVEMPTGNKAVANPAISVQAAGSTPNPDKWPSGGYGQELYIYRAAVALQGKKAQLLGIKTKAAGLALISKILNGSNLYFQMDLGIQLQIVPNDTLLIFLDASDPYDDSSHYGGSFIYTNARVLDSLIGPTNYDLGDVVSDIYTGVASLGGGTCGASAGTLKGASASWDASDNFCHEIGHLFLGPHNYGFLSGPYVKQLSGRQLSHGGSGYHSYSLTRMANRIRLSSAGPCANKIPTANTPPTVFPTVDGLTIPANTPFVLSNTLTIDPDPTANLTYAWENMDGTDELPGPGADTSHLVFSPDVIKASGNLRYIPTLSSLISGIDDPYSHLPFVNRSIRLRFIVRDNQLPAGGVNMTFETFRVYKTEAPFTVTAPSTLSNLAAANSTLMVSWNKAGTDLPPISASGVDILLSTDSGRTFPYTILSNTPNDGSQVVTLPSDASCKYARIMVKGHDNIFFNINPTFFQILPDLTSDYTLTVDDTLKIAYLQPSVNFGAKLRSVNFPYPITLSVAGLPAGVSSDLPMTINPGAATSAVTFNFSNFQTLTPGRYPLILSASGNGSVKTQTIYVSVPSDPLQSRGRHSTFSTDNYINFPELNWKPSAFTFECWINPARLDDNVQNITSGDKNFSILSAANNRLNVTVANVTATVSIVPRTWNHLAVVYAKDSMQVMLNGNIIIKKASPNMGRWSKGFNLGEASPTSRRLSGDFDEIRLWSRALTVKEIREYMHLTRSKADITNNGLEVYLQFDEAGTTPRDVISKYKMLLGGKPMVYLASAAPVSGGFSVTKTVSAPGLVSFSNANYDTGLDIAVTNTVGGDMVVSRLNGKPVANLPTTDSVSSTYWIVHNYGDSLNLNPVFQFRLPDFVQSCRPSDAGLYKRSCNAAGTWNETYTASSVNLLQRQVNFSGASNVGQLIVSRKNASSLGATISPTVCFSYLSPSGKYTWNTSGIYSDPISIPSSLGCDSVLTVNLTVNKVDTTVSFSNNSFMANASNANFQWLNCSVPVSPIPNATTATYAPIVSGSYAVVVTQNGCVDTSGCRAFTLLSTTIEVLSGNPGIVYPNPSNGSIHLQFVSPVKEVRVQIYSMDGQLIQEAPLPENGILETTSTLAAGTYLLKIEAKDQYFKPIRWIKY